MTKFSDDFINEVQEFYADNKGKCVKCKNSKLLDMQGLADHFGILFNQARRMIYVKSFEKKFKKNRHKIVREKRTNNSL